MLCFIKQCQNPWKLIKTEPLNKISARPAIELHFLNLRTNILLP